MSDTTAAVLQIGALVLALAVCRPAPGSLPGAHLHLRRSTSRSSGWPTACCALDPDADQHWRTYLTSVLGFSLVGVLVLFALRPPPAAPAAVARHGGAAQRRALNTAVSFVTNTNWQWYSGEAAAGHLFQMSGLDGAELRLRRRRHGRRRRLRARRWPAREHGGPDRQLLGRPGPRRRAGAAADLVRRGACVLVAPRRRPEPRRAPGVTTLAGGTQTVTGGPVASQEAIKELGTNGGGFYNANSAHPFENPTPLTNLLEIYLHPADPVRDGVRLRSDRRRPSPGLRRRSP